MDKHGCFGLDFGSNQHKIDLFQHSSNESHYINTCHLVSSWTGTLSKVTLPFEG